MSIYNSTGNVSEASLALFVVAFLPSPETCEACMSPCVFLVTAVLWPLSLVNSSFAPL